MKPIYFVLLIFGCINHYYSQDTIRFINKTSQAVKVHEIGIAEIKYNRLDNLEGPLYIANKSEIEYIKFANGHVDSMTVNKAKPISSDFAIISGNPISSDDKITIIGNKLAQHGKPVGESRLLRIINNVPDPEKKTVLNKEYLVMKSYKKKQYLFGFVGLGVGVALPYIGLMSSFLFDDGAPFVVGVATGLTVGITGAIISSVNKGKRTKKRIEIAKLYNN